MTRRNRKKPPHPGMKWNDKYGMWVDADTRTPNQRRSDENILTDLDSDQERIREILRNVSDAGDPLAIEKAASQLAARLLKALIRARSSAGISQAEVARRMGVPQPTIVRLEAGTHSPTLSTLARYASAIGVVLDVHEPV